MTVKKIEFPKSMMADGRQYENSYIAISLQRLTDFDELWHYDTDCPPTGDTPLKFRIFQKNKMAAVVMLKTTQIAISQQLIDRSSRNLARLCKMGLLSAQTVKKIEFPKSKMADGRHCENC